MRYQPGTFITIPNKHVVIGMRPESQAVYLWLCDHANEEGECFPSRTTVAKESGLRSIRSVDKAIGELIASGILSKHQRVEGNIQLSNTYQIHIVEKRGSAGGAGGGAYDAGGVVQEVHPPGALNAHRTKPIELNPLEPNPERFETVWSSYPRKVGKAAAFKAWQRLGAGDREKARAALPAYVASVDAKREGGRFVLHLATYLNQRRFEDELAGPVSRDLGTSTERFGRIKSITVKS